MADPLPWSFTALSDFENCPWQYYNAKVLRRYPFVSTKETEWGKVVHKAFENYILYRTPLPADLLTHKEFLDDFLAQPGDVAGEERIALNRRLEPCAYFGDPKIWYRGQVDARKRDLSRGFSHILDHKTGKQKAELDQLKQFALYEFLTQPGIHTVKVEYYWTQTKAATGTTFVREAVPQLLRELLPRLDRFAEAFINDNFPPKQSGLCAGWCPVTDCQFWRPKRS